MFESNDQYVSEDTVQCFFYSSCVSDSSYWQEMQENVNRTVKSLVMEYIWHRDEFKVHLPVSYNDKPPHLVSSTCFGDNIEDEWFIVYLAMTISNEYEDLIIQIQDNDGEFLLIEAADCLPKWANPDTTENRVFIYRNYIHLIPPALIDEDTINLQEAIKIVVDPEIQTTAPDIQQVILNRIGTYPGKYNENIHKAVVKLPIDVAALLKLQPSLISPLVNTYCSHDMIDAKICKNIKFEDCVLTEVKFTKCLYAMLIHSKLIRNNKYAILYEHDKKSNLGIKLTCAYEMIMSTMSSDIFSSKAYNKFHKSLIDNGYFNDNIEGSKDYTKLLAQARDFFVSMECPINSKVSNDITKVMNSPTFTELKEQIHTCPEECKGDNEDWLNIHPDQLNDMLNSRYGIQSTFKKNDIINAETITSELSSFLKKTSDFEGIEQPEREDNDDNVIDFNVDEFADSLKHMLTILSNGRDERDSDFTDSNDEDMEKEHDLDRELKSKLHTDNGNHSSNKSVLSNIIQSIKEEGGSSGPSSNVLRSIGISKRELLDSDDDED